MTTDAANFVADSIDDRLTQVRLHGAHVPRLEAIETPEDVQYRFLDKVSGIQ
jgi:hypothetical protein